MKKSDYQVIRNEGLWPRGDMTREAFIARIWEEGAAHYRDFPWRHIDDPYGVLVSEVMLQQTQVTRVEKYWARFLEAFPTIESLAEGTVAEVLALWQGLGYNRRALGLKRAAEEVVASSGGVLPDTFDALVALPSIGPATAAGILAFAYQKPAVYLETNVRAVYIYELFPEEEKVPDADLLPFVADTVSEIDPRGWYYALLDYGATLKARGINPSRASTSYTRQSAFEGSRRQKRAELVRIVLSHPEGINKKEAKLLLDKTEEAAGRGPVEQALFNGLIEDLCHEGFIVIDGSEIRIGE